MGLDGRLMIRNDRTSLVAHGWYKASKHRRIPPSYVRFIALWEALCAWSRDVLNSSNDTDLQKWLTDNLRDWHNHHLSDRDYSRAVHEFSELSPIGIMLGAERTGDVSITDESDFAQVVRATYTVRCNLMKGGKPPRPTDREVKVCESASDVLDAVVEHLLSGR